MAKSVCKYPKIELYDVDITRWFAGLDLGLRIGELNECELTLIDDPQAVSIAMDEPRPIKVGRRFINAMMSGTIKVCDVDISDHVTKITRTVEIGKRPTVTFTLHCNPEMLKINGTAPWVDAGDELTEYEVMDNIRAATAQRVRTYSVNKPYYRAWYPEEMDEF